MDESLKLMTDNPLINFSLYTHMQAEVIRSLGNEICGILDASFILNSDGSKHLDGNQLRNIWGKFWLWIIGSYEIVRTVSQAKGCFTEEVSDRFDCFKRKIAKLRIPFAKQEYAQGGKQPIKAEASIAGIDLKTNDVLYYVKGTRFSPRELICEFDSLISTITIEDVLQRHGNTL